MCGEPRSFPLDGLWRAQGSYIRKAATGRRERLLGYPGVSRARKQTLFWSQRGAVKALRQIRRGASEDGLEVGVPWLQTWRREAAEGCAPCK